MEYQRRYKKLHVSGFALTGNYVFSVRFHFFPSVSETYPCTVTLVTASPRLAMRPSRTRLMMDQILIGIKLNSCQEPEWVAGHICHVSVDLDSY